MTQTQNELLNQAQLHGIDLGAILSNREIQFLNGQFTPNINYARRLRFNINKKLNKMFPNSCNGAEQKSLQKTVTLEGKGMGNHEAKRSGVLLAGSVGFEPTTYSSGGCRAVHFSRKVYCCPTLRALQS